MKTGWQTAAPGGKAIGLMSKPRELLFDTNCLIDIYHGRSRIKPWFDQIVDGSLWPFISVITEAELWRGLRAGEVIQHESLIAQFVVLPLHSEVAQLAGGWMQLYTANGLGWMDAFITAAAKHANLPLLTRDKKLANLLGAEVEFELYD